MFPLNRYAKGLLGFLDAKTEGYGPSLFEDALRGTLDVAEFMQWGASDFLNTVIVPVNGTTGFFGLGPEVAEGEIHLLLGIGLTLDVALPTAGDTTTYTAAIRRGASGLFHEAIGEAVTWSTGFRGIMGGPQQLPKILLPRDQAGVWISRTVLAAGNAQATGFAIQQRIRV